MAWLAVDEDGSEIIFDEKPIRVKKFGAWGRSSLKDSYIELPKGFIKKLIGRELTWEDEAVEI